MGLGFSENPVSGTGPINETRIQNLGPDCQEPGKARENFFPCKASSESLSLVALTITD